MSEREGREGRPQHRALTNQNNAQSKEQSRPRSERRSGSDRRVEDRRQGRERAAPFLSTLAPEFRQAKKTPIEATTVLNVENAPRLLKPAWIESNRFFAKDITELEVPDSFYKTEERLRQIGFTRAEPLVLPQRTLLKNDPLWEGRVKPERWFWRKIQNGKLKAESAILEKGVYLIDERARPVYKDGQQRYEDDGFMEDLIKGLRRKGRIEKFAYGPEYSRFGVSPWEIEQVILPEFASAIGKDALGSEGRVVNNPYIIFNVVENMRHPEWGYSKYTGEWFGDEVGSDYRLLGGCSDPSGLTAVGTYYPSNDRSSRVGFRPLIAFS